VKLSNLFRPTNFKRIIFFLVGDIFLSIISIYLSYLLRFNFDIPDNFFKTIPTAIILILIVKIPFLYLFRQYSVTWRFYSFSDAKNLVKAHFISYIIIFILFIISLNQFHIPRSIAIIDMFISLSFIGGFRFFKRILIETTFTDHNPTIFIGINNKSVDLIKSALRGELDIYPIAVLDERPNIQYLSNVKVLDINELENIKNIKTAIITKELSQKELDKLTNRLTKLNIYDIKIATNFENKLKDISIEDLLARKPKDINTTEIEKFIKDRIILVTGAGGSIGSEIVRQCDKFGAKQIIMVDKCEFNLYKIANEVKAIKVLCSINSPILEDVFKTYKPEIVIHAAAYKHVPLCEENPKSCIFNNVFGSINVINLSIKYGVKKFVNISTDKAVRPTNVMGVSKRIVEKYAKNVPSGETEIVSVRFGNVLGSSGSVVPFFKEKIENNENLPVTHPEITRYFMLIPEACSLVLQAGAIAKGGELFILDMGEPVKIKDLAKKMIALSGKDLKIEYMGLRPGEKLYEELLIDEADLKTKYESILIVNEPQIEFENLQNDIKKLKQDIKILSKIVPDYKGSLAN
jgi:UDP-N-acetyl-D-glucosamine 4,6-dehydratase